MLLGLLILAGFAWWLFHDLPDPRTLEAQLSVPSVQIVDRNGRLLYTLLDDQTGRNMVLPFSEMPEMLQQATIATEDKSFYENPGVDLMGIARAMWINLQGGEVLAGGSTITQQVSRNLLLSAEERSQRTVRRKLRESWLAWRVARLYDKETILSLYLNQMYYGGLAYGVEAASQTFFNKPANELTLAETALLAGLTQSPAHYNPLQNPDAAKARQEVVLLSMLRDGYITEEEYTIALQQPLQYNTNPYPIRAPHFVLMVQDELDQLLTEEQRQASGGLTVRTTLNLDWQQQGELVLQEQLKRLNEPVDGSIPHHAHNAALVAIDPHTGDVLTLVGNPDFFDDEASGSINMALQPRQPGSALKPFIYAAAMAPQRHTPTWTAGTMIPDVRTAFVTKKNEPYVPVNFSRTENGPVQLREALAASLNIPAVAALNTVGMETALGLVRDFGVALDGDPDDYDLSFALGGGAVSLFDLTRAYAGLANGGARISTRLILEIRNEQDDLIYQAQDVDKEQVLDERVAWVISDILSDNEARALSFGLQSVLQVGRVTAVKTGTTNDFHDNWTMGYTPDLAVGVWVGNANNDPMIDVTGISGAGPIFHYFLRGVLTGVPDNPFPQPAGLVQQEICLPSGLLPTADCPYTRQEWFLAGTEPTQEDTIYQHVTLDNATHLLATENTPLVRRETRLILDLEPKLHEWARNEGYLLLDDLLIASAQAEHETEQANAPLQLLTPDPFTIYRIAGTSPPETQRIKLEAVAQADVTSITLFVDGQMVATFAEPPYTAWWTLSPGQHEVWATGIAFDGSSLQTDTVSFRVKDVDEE